MVRKRVTTDIYENVSSLNYLNFNLLFCPSATSQISSNLFFMLPLVISLYYNPGDRGFPGPPGFTGVPGMKGEKGLNGIYQFTK